MADDRVPDARITITCGYDEQKNSKLLHIFEAKQFKRQCKRGKSVQPRPPLHDEFWWISHYRIRERSNGPWLSPSGKQYHFFSAVEVLEMIGQLGNFKMHPGEERQLILPGMEKRNV